MNRLSLALLPLLFSGLVHAASPPQRLSRWTLDTPASTTDTDVKPRRPKPASTVDGLAAGAIRFTAETGSSPLAFPTQDADGRPLISLAQGTVRFLYRPAWSTAQGGPGQEAALLQLGRKGQDDYWAVRIPPNGRELQFVQFAGNEEYLAARAPLTFSSNQWVPIALTYGPAGCRFFTNGIPIGPPPAPPRPPRVAKPFPPARATVWIGGDDRGQSLARGDLDELETFNQPLTPGLLRYDLETGLSASVDHDPPRIQLSWRNRTDWPLTLRRRLAGQTEWSILKTNCLDWSFADSQVTPGQPHEYSLVREAIPTSVNDRYLLCGIDLPPTEFRGTALVLVDQTLAPKLRDELDQYAEDLTGDGWHVRIREAPRHNDAQWSNNTNAITHIRELVDTEAVNCQGRLRLITLIGHVAIPHSGNCNPDGHHSRPFPVDSYYGDLVRSTNDWTDLKDFPSYLGPREPASHRVKNGPGDGYFDQELYPSPLEAAVGRIDFAGLPAFERGGTNRLPPRTEIDLLRGYLDKLHRYRLGQLAFPDRIAVFYLPYHTYDGVETYRQALRNGAAWFGPDLARYHDLNFFREAGTNRYLWACQFAPSSYTATGAGNPRGWSVQDLVDPANERAVFGYLLDGSFIGDWAPLPTGGKDNFLRALLAQPDSGFVALWGRLNWGDVLLQNAGWGEPLGRAWIASLNSIDRRDSDYHYSTVHISFLGDPALRLRLPPPVENLRAASRSERVLLAWTPRPDRAVHYHVYRLNDQPGEPPVRLTTEPVSRGRFVDNVQLTNQATYLVRTLQTTVTGCGSYGNLGQAARVTVSPDPR